MIYSLLFTFIGIQGLMISALFYQFGKMADRQSDLADLVVCFGKELAEEIERRMNEQARRA